MDKVFLDSSGIKAVRDEGDDFHSRAVEVWEEMLENEKVTMYVSNYVLDESFTLLRKRCGRETVKLWRSYLVGFTEKIKILRVTIADEAGAWEWFLNDWSDLSFSDCVSFAMMKRLGIKKYFGFDDHFSRAGFDQAQ
jgi:predicted nucleic acid-binding protein